MTNGVERRSQIDTETVKGLLLINGGGAVALLAFLPSVLDKPSYEPLARMVLIGLFAFHLGLLSAVLHNHFRRRCSLTYERFRMNPPKGSFLWCKLPEPLICHLSLGFMWASVVAFTAGGLLVLWGGLRMLG